MSQFGKKVRVLGISISRWVMLKRVERSGEEDESMKTLTPKGFIFCWFVDEMYFERGNPEMMRLIKLFTNVKRHGLRINVRQKDE
ncbi:hypothetical protein BY996DRAFT_6459150 [Phakopsora pachyrhizi]|nr:hypothetical protein BY996DRAFT_6459150 [Phakopsora pachyrhizi]